MHDSCFLSLPVLSSIAVSSIFCLSHCLPPFFSVSFFLRLSPHINDIINCLFSVMVDDVEAQQDFDDFFEEVFTELEDKV